MPMHRVFESVIFILLLFVSHFENFGVYNLQNFVSHLTNLKSVIYKLLSIFKVLFQSLPSIDFVVETWRMTTIINIPHFVSWKVRRYGFSCGLPWTNSPLYFVNVPPPLLRCKRVPFRLQLKVGMWKHPHVISSREGLLAPQQLPLIFVKIKGDPCEIM